MGARTTKTLLAAAVGGAMLTVATTPSLAQGPWYGSITGNAVWLSDSDWSGGTLGGNIEYHTGWGIDGALGYSLSGNLDGFRVEGEVGYRDNDVDKINVNGIGVVPGTTTGDVNIWTGLLNGYYDIDLGSNFKPYVGAGLGIARVSADISVTLPGAPTLSASESDTVFAYQLSAGVGYALSPSTTLFAGYRYLATDDPEFTNAGVTFTSEYHSHNAQAGVRFSF